MPRSFCCVAWLALQLACNETPHCEPSFEQLYTVTISGIGYIGAHDEPSDWTPPSASSGIGSRTFEVYGTFPQATRLNYRPHVRCDGRQWPAQILAGHGTEQMNISIPDTPMYPFDGTSCWFMLELGDDSRPIHAAYSNGGTYVGPVTVSPALRITSASDDGVDQGEHQITLRDPGLGANDYAAIVSCSGLETRASVVARTSGSVQIRFAYAGAPRDCRIQLALDGSRSNAWVIRDGSPAANPATVPELGAYVWGGYQSDAQGPTYTALASPREHLRNAAQRVADAGYRSTMRFVMTPTMRLPGNNNVHVKGPCATPGELTTTALWLDGNIYDFASDLCPIGGAPFLGCLARSAAFQSAFDAVASGGTIVLTAYDEATIGPVGYCVAPTPHAGCNADPGYLSDPARARAIRAEYQALTYALYETQHDTGKRFLIGNWETENQLYAGGLYPVLAAYHHGESPPPGNQAAQIRARKDGLVRWFQLRQEGIRCGIYLATGQRFPAGVPCTGTPHTPPYSNVEVYDAIEMASLRAVKDIGYLGALADIIPVVRPAYVTYSAWDTTIARGTVDEDLDTIEAALAPLVSPITGAQPYLALGELGTIKPTQNDVHAWRNTEIIKAAYRAFLPRPGATRGPPPMILWQAFTGTIWHWATEKTATLQLAADQAQNDDDGLFDHDGYERRFSRAIRSELTSYASTGALFPRAATDPYIVAATDLGLDQGRHHFELRGQFPAASGYEVRATCDGVDAPALVSYLDPDQRRIQVHIADPGSGVCVNGFRDGTFCTFEIRHATSAWSPLYGPRHVCPGPGGVGIPYPQGQDWGGGCTATCS